MFLGLNANIFFQFQGSVLYMRAIYTQVYTVFILTHLPIIWYILIFTHLHITWYILILTHLPITWYILILTHLHIIWYILILTYLPITWYILILTHLPIIPKIILNWSNNYLIRYSFWLDKCTSMFFIQKNY